MKLTHIIGLILITAMTSCTQSTRPKADHSIAPRFVTEQPTFNENARLVFNSVDTLSAMIVDATEEQTLDQLFAPINQHQAIIARYADERRRSYTMANIGQSLDIVFLNSGKMVIHTVQHRQTYSTEAFSSFEYAQYTIILSAGNCDKKNIKECDIVEFLHSN